MNLFVHSAALGDFVLTFPLVRALAGEPMIVAAPWTKAKLAARLFSHATPLSIEKLNRWHVEGGGSDAMAGLESVNRVFSFVSSGTDAWAANARAALPHAVFHFLQPRPPADWPRHVTDWHAHQLREQGWIRAAADAATQNVWHGQAAALGGLPVAGARETNAPILVHPGSGGRDKCWPTARFEAIIRRLRDAGHAVRPILGEAERERWTQDQLSHWRGPLGARETHDLDELCDQLLAARAYLGNDSGPAHLAAQLGLPTVAIFGPTDPRLWSPRGPRVTVVAPPSPRSMDWLEVDAVWSVLEPLLAPRRG